MSRPQEPRAAARRTRSILLTVTVAAAAAATAALWVTVLGIPQTGVPAETRAVGASGRIAEGASVLAEIPAVTNLDPRLRTALRRAATDAADDGVELAVNSGWRSSDYQEQLFREAAEKYGSDEEARRWVARPGASVHEAGDAVDIGPSTATAWLAEHGASFGLCRIYDNEPWHYELRTDAVAHGCPPTYADPTEDPRMQR
ncbi:M15 family metallopeptidase [Mumia sp. zg.B21]|uniref:M15 family metallopeptidase n=1 Tax=Mumia sp. zg.B21 TaxID=2855447 RepID=UPI001C6E8166|nr:M15 family metallopeptidase [Mumia sp. zg.B21]MBW9208227.1 M15 family metallopeptidase [Mumia sp. zg.B21]